MTYSILLFSFQFSVNEVQRNFVVAQGPMEHTCADFWQMVWEQGIKFILMVTNEKVRKYVSRETQIVSLLSRYLLSLGDFFSHLSYFHPLPNAGGL